MNLGENIYKYRKQAGMSQGDLADALDVSRQSVSKWETGAAVPELDKLVKMSAIFGITLDELVTGSVPRTTTIHTVSLPAVLSLVLLIISILCFSILSIFCYRWGFHEDIGILYGLTFLLAGVALRYHDRRELFKRLAWVIIPVFLAVLILVWVVLPFRYLVFAFYWSSILLVWWLYLRHSSE